MRKRSITKKEISKIVNLGKQKGFLTYEQVNNLLPEDVCSSRDIDRLFDLLGSQDIPVVENAALIRKKLVREGELALKKTMGLDSTKSEQRSLPLDDPVKMYLKQMGSVALLSRQEEIELAKRIETAEMKFRQAVFSCLISD